MSINNASDGNSGQLIWIVTAAAAALSETKSKPNLFFFLITHTIN